MKIFKPVSPDPSIGKVIGDNALAKLSHLNEIVVNLNQFSSSTNLTAHAGGGQALGTHLITGLNIVTTTTTGDSVTLPCLAYLCECSGGCSGPMAPTTIMNNGPGDLQVYPCLGEAINGQSVNTPITVLAGTSLPILPVNPTLASLPCAGDCLGCPTTWVSLPGGDGQPGVPGINGNYVTVTPEAPGANCTAGGIEVVLVNGVTNLPISTNYVCNGIDGATGPGFGGYAEFVQHTQSTNSSIAPGLAIEYLTDNPTGVFNTITGLTLAAAPTQGTEFQLPIGVYMIDYENSADAAWSLAIYKGAATSGPYTIDTNTISGSSTATTWIHGRAIVNAVAPVFMIISPVTGTQAIPTAGTAAGEFIARLTILKIG